MPFAPRPHTEIVHTVDIPGREVRFPGSSLLARVVPLSESPANGAISAVVVLPPGWTRDRGANPATFSEYLVLAGDLTVGGETLLPLSYLRAAAGTAVGSWSTNHGARLLLFTNGDPLAWEAGEPATNQADGEPATNQADGVSPATDDLRVIHSGTLDWAISEIPGPAVMDDGARLRYKLLYRDDRNGATTGLFWLMPGWTDERLEHHRCVEESYCIEGESTYSHGHGVAGTYFWRPPLIQHGDFHTGPSGKLSLIRTDRQLENYYTARDGTPIDWGPNDAIRPVPSPSPIRSTSAGPWKGLGF